jgi:hypothetical protein
MAVVATPRQKQVFQLIESHHHRDTQLLQRLHNRFEQGQHEILTRRPNVKIQLGETISQKAGQLGLVVQQHGTR